MNKVKELSINIISIFEELLEKNNITIPDDNRIGDEDEARIYGETYYELEDKILDLLNNSEIIVPIYFEKYENGSYSDKLQLLRKYTLELEAETDKIGEEINYNPDRKEE